MADLTIKDLSLAGLDLTPLDSPAGGGDAFVNDGKTLFLADNQDGTDTDITFDSTQLCDQGFDHNIVVTVPPSQLYAIGMFATRRFGTTVAVTYEKVTLLTVAAVRT
jgi:hypothetical protein